VTIRRSTWVIALCVMVFAASLISSACSSNGDETADSSATSTSASAPAKSSAPATPGGLTPFELEHGIGPITSPVVLPAAIDKTLAARGAQVFEQKCSACHKMDERYVGPPLGDVTKRRSPAFVMNMALDPLGMVEKHPDVKKLLGEYFVAMPNQNISPDEARQVLEYLRTQAH
jgi:mono/diheme cytochrome c family protein